jgi:hypothetical protein
LVLAVLGFSLVQTNPIFHSAADSEIALTRAQSGVALQDSLNSSFSQQQLQDQTGAWSFGGHYASAHINLANGAWIYSTNSSSKNVNVNFSEDSTGFSINLQAVSNNDYTGFYAASQPVDAELFHARITSSYGSLPSGFLQVGLYVRASAGNTNYVTCADVSSSSGTHWEVLHGTGNPTEATHFDYLWIDSALNESGSNDCTILTNGNNYLAVYLGQSLVYQNNNLALGIQKPFEAFLGVECTYDGQMFSGKWSDFYATALGQVGLINLPSDAVNASIVSPTGSVITSAKIVNGSGALDITKYNFPVDSYIKVYDSGGKEIASTASLVGLMGGDIYTGKATLKQDVAGIISESTLIYFVVPVTALALLAVVVVYSLSKKSKSHRSGTDLIQP